MEQPQLTDLLRLRLTVGYLGERAQFGWWPTSFFEPSSAQFLEPVFVKSSVLAQYHGVVEAARRFHDPSLSVGSFHLFRLPEETEQDLLQLLRRQTGDYADMRVPRSAKDAMALLEHSAAGLAKNADGPVLVGDIAELPTAGTKQNMAGVYWAAFSSGSRAFPYLMARH